MTGVYNHSLDSKGRVFVPAKLREEIGDVCYITISPDSCLNVYSLSGWRELSDKVNAMPYMKQRKIRSLFAWASKCELDAQGRILIPQGLRRYAGIEKNVAVVGANNHAEIWNSDRWDESAAIENLSESIGAIMEELEF